VTTYAQLQADVAAWTARTDIAAVIPSFIRLGEAEIGRVVRALEQETDLLMNCTSPAYSCALPDGFLGFKHVFVSGASEPRTQYVPPTQFHELNLRPRDAFADSFGTALLYTIESNVIKVNRPAGSSEPIVLDTSYVKKFATLDNTNTTNWLLTNHYDVYIWAALKEAWDYVDETEMVAKYQAKFDRVVAQLTALETAKRRASGPLVSRPPQGVF
jgi:hypothetical protein